MTSPWRQRIPTVFKILGSEESLSSFSSNQPLCALTGVHGFDTTTNTYIQLLNKYWDYVQEKYTKYLTKLWIFPTAMLTRNENVKSSFCYLDSRFWINCIYGGTRWIMVIVKENRLNEQNANPGQGLYLY